MSAWGKEIAVDILTVSSVVSAAAFGALGLFTDYKKDGKVTRYGFIAAIGILLSAVMSIAVGLLQDRIESERRAEAAKSERAKRDEEDKRFGEQINRLTFVSATLGDLMADTQRSLLLTEQIGTQQRTSTDRTLRTMWEDAHRIDPSGISATVNYVCMLKKGASLPLLLSENPYMEIYLLPANEARRRVKSYNTFSVRSALGIPTQSRRPWSNNWQDQPGATSGGVTLRAIEVQTFVSRSDQLHFQISRFGPFYPQGMWPYSTPASWRGLVVEAVVRGPTIPIAALTAALREQIGDHNKLASYVDGIDQISDRAELSWLPCRALLQIRINGKMVLEETGEMVKYHDLMIAKFPIIDVPAATFPVFDSINPPLARAATPP